MMRQQNWRQAQPSKLEQLCLEEQQFDTLVFMEELLAPFADAQHCLEGERYVNISLIVLIIKKLQTALVGALAASEHQQELHRVVEEMLADFNEHWGEEILYSSQMTWISGNRQQGMPKYAYWGSLLDPRTKKLTLSLLEPEEKRQIWEDIQEGIVTIAMEKQEEGSNNNNDYFEQQQQQRRPKGAATFLTHGYAEESQHSEHGEDITLIEDIRLEIAMYKTDKGCPLNNENGNYYDPLEWWKINETKYPNIWLLAQRILSIPATSAPSERVFSAAANIIDKKRARITTDNAELVMFLHGNKSLVHWDI